MDIEELSKSQIVLLTILVAFVTSMATGIMTVSMMAKAPPSVAETVNRVIEQTVEKVDPPAQSAAVGATVQEKTVVVNESDLVAAAVQKIQPSIVRLYSGSGASAQFLGIGIVIDNSGTVATDIAALGGASTATVQLEDGTSVSEDVAQRDSTTGLAFLTPDPSSSQEVSWSPASIATADPALGSSVFSFYGQTLDRIGEGLVTTTLPASASTPEVLETDIGSDAIMYGSPLIDTDGDVVGVSTAASRASSQTGFVPASLLSFSPVPAASASSTKEISVPSQ